MLISLCIPVMNRTHDLKQTLPHAIAAANASAPVEIVVLNYSSRDDLDAYIASVYAAQTITNGNWLTYVKIEGKEYFSISKARNAAVIAAHGSYVVILDADIILHVEFIQTLRRLIVQENPTWLCEGEVGRIPVVRHDEFIAAGGYDERFNVCGPEDKEICARLHRRGGKFVPFSPKLVDEIHTPYRAKFANVDQRPYAGEPQIKRAMSRAMRKYLEENNARGLLVANASMEWGKG